MKNRTVCVFGINDLPLEAKKNRKHTRSYEVWRNMLRRCYGPRSNITYPTYTDCFVCEEWLYFSNFKTWYDENYREGFDLDKDILIEGNKIYSPDTCRFVPHRINSLLIKGNNCNKLDNIAIGVNFVSRIINNRTYECYVARCQNGNNKRLVKQFKTLEEASAWYSETKTRIVREVATSALESGEIQQDVFDALIARKF